MKTLFRSALKMSIVPILALAASCTIWNARQWESLEDRSFHFQRFAYYLKGADRRTAFEFMRDFPLDEALRIVAERYSIVIDSSEFRSFMEDPENERSLEVYGVILSERFTWRSKNANDNTIELEYANEFKEESTDTIRRYSFTIRSGGKVRAVLGDTVDKREDVPSSLAELSRRR